jgi:hypothetical protein
MAMTCFRIPILNLMTSVASYASWHASMNSVEVNGRSKEWEGGVVDISERKRLYKGEFISVRPEEGTTTRWEVR